MIDDRSKWWLCLWNECLTDIVFYKKSDCKVTREHQRHHLYDMDGCVSANEMIMMVKIMKKINNNKWSVNQWGLEHNRRCRRQQLCQSFFNNVECWILLQHGIAGPKNIQNKPSSTPGAGLWSGSPTQMRRRSCGLGTWLGLCQCCIATLMMRKFKKRRKN